MKHSPEYNEVKAILKDVAKSQKRTDESLARSAESQKRVDESLARVAESLAHTAESQKRFNKRLARFDAKREKAMSRIEANMEKSRKKDDLRHKRLADQVTEASRVTKENGKHLGDFTINYDKSVKSEFTEALRKTKKNRRNQT